MIPFSFLGFKKLCRRMIWICHVKNASVIKKAVEITVTKQNYNTAPRLKTRLLLKCKNNLKQDFILYSPALDFKGKNNIIPFTKTIAGCIC